MIAHCVELSNSKIKACFSTFPFCRAVYLYLLLSPCDVLLQASRNGATGVELDLSFTADGVPILMHDETVDRTTNGSGPVSNLQLVQLKKLDAAARHRLKAVY